MVDSAIFPVTLSGVRPGEASTVKALITGAGLGVQDLKPQHLVHFIVARKGDAIVGTVGLEPAGEDALLRSLAVEAGHRRQRIARRLVASIEKYARSHGVGRMFLLTTNAADYFVKQGYRPVPRDAAPAPVQATEEFRSLCPDGAVCLSKTF